MSISKILKENFNDNTSLIAQAVKDMLQPNEVPNGKIDIVLAFSFQKWLFSSSLVALCL